jgi:hypothetical protein
MHIKNKTRDKSESERETKNRFSAFDLLFFFNFIATAKTTTTTKRTVKLEKRAKKAF